jgi:hypothetical protein
MKTPEGRKQRHERVQESLRNRESRLKSEEKTDVRFDPFQDDPFQDPVLRELLEPERQRQRTEMLNAIERVCNVILETT